MAEIHSLNNTDANNTARFNGANNVSQLDDAGRALEGMLARFFKDIFGANTTAGSNTAYTIALNRTAMTTHAEVGRFAARFHVANNGACTLVVNSLASKALRKAGNAALVTGDLPVNCIKDVFWNAANDCWEVVL